MAGKPSWFVDLTLNKPSGQFHVHSKFEHRKVSKPTGAFNVTGQYQAPNITRPGHYGKYWVGAYAEREVPKPREKGEFYLHGKYEKPKNTDTDPWGNYYFSFELDTVEIAQFLECSGIKNAAQVFEIEEGGVNWNTHKRPGISKWENIVLKRAVNQSDAFAEWRDYYLQPPGDSGWERRANTSAAIVVRNNAGTELRRYTILQPWPVSWEGPSLSGGGSELSVETLEIAHSGILLDQNPPKPEPGPKPEPEKVELKPVNYIFDRPKPPHPETRTPEGQAAMEENQKELREHPEMVNLWVDGHTCDMGSHSYNLQLSYRRARDVADELMQEDPNRRVKATGYSYDFPKVKNTPSQRATNRRSEIHETERPMGSDGKPAPRGGESRYEDS